MKDYINDIRLNFIGKEVATKVAIKEVSIYLKGLKVKERNAKITEEVYDDGSKGKSFECSKKGFYVVDDIIFVNDISKKIDLEVLKTISLKNQIKITVNFKNETDDDDVVITNGELVVTKLDDDEFTMFLDA